MQGYNACMFAYGQTGSGKTHTVQGELKPGPDGEANPLRGIAPRVFEALFRQIEEREAEEGKGQGTLQYTCRCSYLQIYQESISDLLNPGGGSLALRHDIKRGVYVENLREEVVLNGAFITSK